MGELKKDVTMSKKYEHETKKSKNKNETNKNIVHSNTTRSYKWSQTNVDNARRKINKEIFERDKQSSISIKLDDLSVIVNDKIKRRGIQRGFVNVQEDFNKNLLNIEKVILQALLESDANKKYNLLIEAEYSMRINIWCDIKFLMVNKAITPGEITELIQLQKSINIEMQKWMASIQ